ncbi:MAG: hypothetical protein AAFW47_03645 [Pseudomonadota bacterium]
MSSFRAHVGSFPPKSSQDGVVALTLCAICHEDFGYFPKTTLALSALLRFMRLKEVRDEL